MANTGVHYRDTIAHYLAGYAEAEASHALSLCSSRPFDFSIGVPSYDESPAFIDALQDVVHARTLLVLVLNRPEGSAPSQRNAAVLQKLHSQGQPIASLANLTLFSLSAGVELLLVDRDSDGLCIPRDQGVGLARKIAADIALALHSSGKLHSPWLCATDADATLPRDYFNTIARMPASAAACLFPFTHHARDGSSSRELNMTLRYEKRIRAYVQGLAFAGSAYAFHTLGSTICANTGHYAAVRGYPVRAAGEDFYLLNKLRKTGEVISLETPHIALAARRSARTPFGTGASVGKLLAQRGDEAIFYHPALFLCLRAVLQWQALCARRWPGCRVQAAKRERSDWRVNLQTYLAAQRLEQQLSTVGILDLAAVCTTIVGALDRLGFQHAVTHCEKQASDSEHYARHMRDWFDGFRSLRFIHELRRVLPAFADVDENRSGQLWQQLDAMREPGNKTKLEEMDLAGRHIAPAH